METIKFWEIPKYIKVLTFDGDKKDLRLHLDDIIYWWEDDEEEYNKLEKEIYEFKIVTKEYRIFAWCDISGYDYWIRQQRESNYIQISIEFFHEDFNKDYLGLLEIEIEKAYNKFREHHTSNHF